MSLARRRWPLIALGGLAAAGLANLALRLRGDMPHADYRELWIAGHVWRAGGNPYGAAYRAFGLRSFGEAYPHMWPYPPHIWLLAIPFSLIPPGAGLAIWNGLGVLLTIVAAVLLGRTFGRARARAGQAAIAFAIVAFVGLMTASGSAFLVGQTGYLMLFALALAAWGIAREKAWALALAMALLMLKPQVGLIACVAVLPLKGGLRAAIWAAAIVAVASLPALAVEGPMPVIHGYLANLALYRTISYDMPIAMTGIGHLVAEAGGPDLSAIGMSVIGALAAAMLLWLVSKRAAAVDRAADWLLITIGAITGLAFLHVYDLMLVAPLIALLPRMGFGLRGIGIVAGLALILRPENLAVAAHRDATASVAVASVGCVLLLAAAVRQGLRRAR